MSTTLQKKVQGPERLRRASGAGDGCRRNARRERRKILREKKPREKRVRASHASERTCPRGIVDAVAGARGGTPKTPEKNSARRPPERRFARRKMPNCAKTSAANVGRRASARRVG